MLFMFFIFSYVYYAFGRLVYFFRERKQLHSRRKIVCVGNILAGGVGKTPIVRQIANFLNAPVVMRGYKSTDKTCGVGDEAMMLANDGLLVHTGDRKSNIYLLNQQNEEKGPIVMDDGFQNPSIKKDVSVIVVDEEFGFGNGFLLPAGPKRETLNALYRADAIIIIKSGGDKKKFNLPAEKRWFILQEKEKADAIRKSRSLHHHSLTDAETPAYSASVLTEQTDQQTQPEESLPEKRQRS